MMVIDRALNRLIRSAARPCASSVNQASSSGSSRKKPSHRQKTRPISAFGRCRLAAASQVSADRAA
jgi:hypothetical protein